MARFFLFLIIVILSAIPARALDCNDANLSDVDAAICATIEQQDTVAQSPITVSRVRNRRKSGQSTASVLENNDAGFFRLECIPCKIIEKVIFITNDIGSKVYDAVRGSVLALMGVGLALWILLNVAKLLFPFTPLGSAAQINNLVANRVFIAVISGTFLLSFANFWNYLYAPTIGTGMTYANAVITQSATLAGGKDNLLNKDQQCAQAFAGGFGSPEESTQRLAARMDCLVKSMTMSISLGLDVAMVMIDIKSIDIQNIGKFLGNLVPAILIAWTYGKILIFFPFRIVDIVLRWGIFVILSPLIIAAFVFPSTRSFTIKGIQGIVEGAFELVMIAVLIALAVAALSSVASDNNGGDQNLDAFFNAIRDGAIDINFGTGAFWGIYLTGWITDIMMGQTKKLAKAFSSADGSSGSFDIDLGSQVAQEAASAAATAKGLAQSVGGSFIKGLR